ncbi:4-(cytidine 5'-diphospho)-2-C-methyl-D-erythritol kinase [Shewanella sp. OPT22]|nr:4-(cytidine 5'-diphospho)-2-C-methyl-D-erythritol kinase [Shewanella sp. OPT22]
MTLHTLKLPAPAKLNLCLHINGRREDGYHELQTVFQFLDKSDYLEFTTRDDDQLNLHSELNQVVASSDNLILKAAKLLQQQTKTAYGADISLEKNLPMGGGIGGGSSDAATTLLALNKLWQTNLSTDDLASIGIQLGADIPVFIRGFAAFAEGIGEILNPISLPEKWYLVLTPDVHVSTVEVFTAPELHRCTPRVNADDLFTIEWKNDCQPLVVNKYPQVAKALDWLIEYAPSRMTGTGACVFAEFDNEQQAQAVYAKLPTDLNGFVAKGLNRSPVLNCLAEIN